MMNSRQIGGVVLGEREFEQTKRTIPGSATALPKYHFYMKEGLIIFS